MIRMVWGAVLWIVILGIGGMTFASVILRYAFHVGLPEFEEASRFCLVTLVFLGLPLAVFDGIGRAGNLFVRRFFPHKPCIGSITIWLIAMAASGLLLLSGIGFWAQEPYNFSLPLTLEPGLMLPFYSLLPLCAGLTMVALLWKACCFYRETRQTEEEE